VTDIDDLYALPLDGFTQARDVVAAELRKAGKKSEASEVKKLRKPSLAAWAVNQVARAKPDAMEKLFELRQRIEDSSSAADMRAASEERTRLISELVRVAESILSEAGRATGANTVQAITQTFHAGDNEADREALLRGRITRELSPEGFGGFSLSLDPDATDVDEAPDDPRREEKQLRAEKLAEEAKEVEAEAVRLEDEASSAERAFQRARARADVARRSADEARKHAERAGADLDRPDS
jgi:hypothetical protein